MSLRNQAKKPDSPSKNRMQEITDNQQKENRPKIEGTVEKQNSTK